MRWWSSAPHKTLQETRAYIAVNASSAEWPTWAITLGDDIAVGWVVFSERRAGVREIGYILRADHGHRGIAREAVTAVLDHGFNTLGVRRVYADTDPENIRSIRLVEALGFTLEGRLRSEWETHIGVRDSLIWGLLAEEWRKR